MDVAGILGSISSALSVTKELVAINKVLDEAQWKLKLAELSSALADAKVGVVELKEQLQAKDAQIVTLKKAFEFQGKCVRIHDDLYEELNGTPIGMPFCPRCSSVDGIFIKLAETLEPGHPARCPQCKANYGFKSGY